MASTINTLGYALYENRFARQSSGNTTYYARVQPKGRVTEKELIEFIIQRNSTVTKAEVTAVFDLLEEVVKTSIRMGFTVSTRLFHASLTIQGLFDSMTDSFDPLRHSLVLKILPAKPLKDHAALITGMTKDDTVLPTPGIFRLYDYASNENNAHVTPGNTAALDGVNFQLDPEKTEQGVYFTTNTDPVGVKALRIVSASAKKIVFQVPPVLTPGAYTLEVRCGFGSILRTAKLILPVVVAEPGAA